MQRLIQPVERAGRRKRRSRLAEQAQGFLVAGTGQMGGDSGRVATRPALGRRCLAVQRLANRGRQLVVDRVADEIVLAGSTQAPAPSLLRQSDGHQLAGGADYLERDAPADLQPLLGKVEGGVDDLVRTSDGRRQRTA